MRISAARLLLGLLGGGWSGATWPRRGSVIEVAGLAPAFGLYLVVLVGTAIALLGATPEGPPDLGAVALAGSTGWILAWRRTRSPRPEMLPYESSASASSTRSTSSGV